MESGGFNRAPKQPSPEKGESLSTEGLRELREVLPALYARLALLDLKGPNAELSDEEEEFDRNDPQRQEALMTWATGGMAAKFSDYIEDPLHASETINPGNTEELRAFLRKLRSESDTMH